jgi:hypothetical protein
MFDRELSMVAPLAHLACCPAGQLMPGNGTWARLMNSSGSPGHQQRRALEIEGSQLERTGLSTHVAP